MSRDSGVLMSCQSRSFIPRQENLEQAEKHVTHCTTDHWPETLKHSGGNLMGAPRMQHHRPPPRRRAPEPTHSVPRARCSVPVPTPRPASATPPGPCPGPTHPSLAPRRPPFHPARCHFASAHPATLQSHESTAMNHELSGHLIGPPIGRRPMTAAPPPAQGRTGAADTLPAGGPCNKMAAEGRNRPGPSNFINSDGRMFSKGQNRPPLRGDWHWFKNVTAAPVTKR